MEFFHSLIFFIILITELVKAVNDMWFLGDSFLKDLTASFHAQKANANLNNKQPPYAQGYFNTDMLYQNPNAGNSNQSGIGRVINALAEKLNDKDSVPLPKFILIILECDIIKQAQFYDYGIAYILDQLYTWLQKNIEMFIETRKGDLKIRKPGAVLSATYPKFIWVLPLQRPPITLKRNIFALVSKCMEAISRLNHALRKFFCSFSGLFSTIILLAFFCLPNCSVWQCEV